MQTTKIFLLLLFAGYYFSLLFFQHTHIIDNKVVAHSHPYNTPNHQHSGSDFQLLRNLSSFNSIPTNIFESFCIEFTGVDVLFGIQDAPFLKLFHSDTVSLRAPPIF